MNDNRLNSLWLAESIRLTEQQSGPLADADANRKARAASTDISQRIIERARLLAQRDGLQEAQHQWLQGAKLAGLLLILFALASGAGLAFAALGDGSQPVNIFWALGSLLGLNLLMLLLWLLGTLFTPNSIGSALGRVWLWLTGKFSRNARSIQLVPALMILLNRQRAARWGIGLLVHGFWTLVGLSSLIVLLALLTTRHYDFIWQTTLLSGDSFISITHLLGAIPAWFGFPIPNADTILASGNSVLDIETVRSTWASWLVGVLVIFGLLPRAFLTIFCLLRWHFSRAKLALDLTLAENIILAERLQPTSERLGVTDSATEVLHQHQRQPLNLVANGLLLVAIELDNSHHWPPVLPDDVQNAGILNDRYQRHQLLDQLQLAPAARLLIVCDPLRSPDRGTLNLIAELADNAADTRVWLINDRPLDESRLQHWRDALKTLGLQEADLSWLENIDD